MATTSGHEKVKISAAFCASADGRKLPVLLIIPRKTDIPDFNPPENVVLHYKTSATLSEDVIKNEFFGRVLGPHAHRQNIKPRLILDNASCHKSKIVTDAATSANIQLFNIPPNLTSILQPADVCWFAPIKSKLHDKWTQWYMNEDVHTFTKANNLRSPGYANVINWISEIWRDLDNIAQQF